jgi:hypothetical protein
MTEAKRLEPLTLTEYKLIRLIRTRLKKTSPGLLNIVVSHNKIVCSSVTAIKPKRRRRAGM